MILLTAYEVKKRLAKFTSQAFMKHPDHSPKMVPDYICEEWNADLQISEDSYMKYINFSFKICDGCDKYFHSYEFNLFRTRSDDCDLSNGDHTSMVRIATLKNQNAEKSFSGSFKHVAKGSYCVFMIPIADKPYPRCSRHSEVITISDSVKPEIGYNISREDFKNLTVAASVVFSFAILFLLVILWWKYKSNAVETTKMLTKSKRINECEGDVDLPIADKNIQVYIIHSHYKENVEKVHLLKNYLQNYAKYDVILDDDVIDEILIDPSGWLTEMLEYKCSEIDSCDSLKRLIIVESENVGQYFDINGHVCEVDAVEEIWYHSEINSISSDWARCLNDYCHLFVVNFGNSLCPSKKLKHVTSRVRYTIPDHLIDLCMNLETSKLKNSDARRKELMKYLENHPIKKIKYKTVK